MSDSHRKPTVVIKVGTSSLVSPDNRCLSIGNIARLCEVVKELHTSGFSVVLVSSGAVGVGCQRLKLDKKPSSLAAKQALAAVGQLHLMRYYDDLFGSLGLSSAQVLLTLDNFANRGQYLNARNTFDELLKFGVIPIVNENDTVAVEQLRFGDNDTLSAQVATILRADWLFLLTDVDSLYTSNPNTNPDAKPIHEVSNVADLEVDTSTSGTQWGTGGMATKLTAARIATAAGCKMVISHAAHVERIPKIIAGERLGTVFQPVANALKGRRRWILSVPVKLFLSASQPPLWKAVRLKLARGHRRRFLFVLTINSRIVYLDLHLEAKTWQDRLQQLPVAILSRVVPQGALWLDDGAARAVWERRKSLFAVGVKNITGDFCADDAVSICRPNGEEFARGLVSYDMGDARKIMGKQNEEHLAALGYHGSEYLVSRDNISLLPSRNPDGSVKDEDDDQEWDDSPDSFLRGKAAADANPAIAKNLSMASLNLIHQAQREVNDRGDV